MESKEPLSLVQSQTAQAPNSSEFIEKTQETEKLSLRSRVKSIFQNRTDRSLRDPNLPSENGKVMKVNESNKESSLRSMKNTLGETTDEQQEEDEDTYQWEIELLFTLSSTLVGLSNILIFADHMNKYGGWAYLIPYTVCMLCYSMHLLFVEVFIGQFTRVHPVVGFPRIAPLLKVFAWTDVFAAGLASLRATVIVILAFKVMMFESSIEDFTSCQTSMQPLDCVSHIDTLWCRRNTSHEMYYQSSKKLIYFHKGCYPGRLFHDMAATETLNYSLPMRKFNELLIDPWSGSFEEIGMFDWRGWLVVVALLFVLTVLTILPICFVARLQGFFLIVGFTLLLLVVCHIHYGKTIDFVNLNAHEILNPRFDKLLDIQTWTTALQHSVVSASVGQSKVATQGIFSKRSTLNIKFVIGALLVDISFGVLGSLLCAGVSNVIRATTSGLISYENVTKPKMSGSSDYLFGTVLQVLTYYESKAWILIYLFAIIFMLLPALIVFTVYLLYFIREAFFLPNWWKSRLMAFTIHSIMLTIFAFENYQYILIWCEARTPIIISIGLTFRQLVYMGCYGSAQMRFDLFFLLGQPKTFGERFWHMVNEFSKKMYFNVTPLITMYYLCYSLLTVDWQNEDVTPVNELRSQKSLAMVANPLVLIAIIAFVFVVIDTVYKQGSLFELLRVQPGLPSYNRIRETVQDFEIRDAFLQTAPSGSVQDDFRALAGKTIRFFSDITIGQQKNSVKKAQSFINPKNEQKTQSETEKSNSIKSNTPKSNA